MIKNILLAITVTLSLQISAQNPKKCNTTPLVEYELQNNPEYTKGRAESIAENSAWIKEGKSEKATINIPVVIHIVHKNSHANIGSGTNIPTIQIEDALRILNEDYSKTNPEFPNPPRNIFLNYAGNPDLKFCLATTDPDGNPTSGITRTATTKSGFDADDNTDANAMKKTSTGGKDAWDPSKYLNIWICNLTNSAGGGMTLGYAYLPGLPSWNVWKDGLVVDFQYFGTVGNASGSSDGRTATHEIGHYLGLMHTFCEQTDSQGNFICCDNDNNNQGGNVDDTPATKDIYFGSVTASTNNNTCNDITYPNVFTTNVLDMDENYMSYSSNSWMFSIDQTNVMAATLNGYRSSLKSSNVSTNCSGTVGINDIQLNNINIYPNPTKGELVINTNEAINTISISNMIGAEVYTTKTPTKTIDLSMYKNGIYFLNIHTDKGIYIEKIVISK